MPALEADDGPLLEPELREANRALEAVAGLGGGGRARREDDALREVRPQGLEAGDLEQLRERVVARQQRKLENLADAVRPRPREPEQIRLERQEAGGSRTSSRYRRPTNATRWERSS